MRISDWSSDVCSSDLKGFDGFYRGETANKLIKGVNDEGGKWTAEELAAYKVRERAPLVFEYDGWKITTAPPPSSGGIALAEMMQLLEPWYLAEPDATHRHPPAVDDRDDVGEGKEGKGRGR